MTNHKLRQAFTLIELLVAISIIILLAALTVAFLPSVRDQQRAAQGATMLQSALSIAKQQAFRDNRGRGIRLLPGKTDPMQVTDLQYLEQPDDFTPAQPTTVSPPTGMLLWNAMLTNGNALQMHIANVDLLNNSPDPTLWTVQRGDSLELMGGGLVHKIIDVAGSTPPGLYSSLWLASFPDSFAPRWDLAVPSGTTAGSFTLKVTADSATAATAGIVFNATPADIKAALESLPNVGPGNVKVTQDRNLIWHITISIPRPLQVLKLEIDTYSFTPSTAMAPPALSRQALAYYRIIRAPRVVGTDTIQLPNNIVVDFKTNNDYGNSLPLNVDKSMDIMFAPSGAVMTPGITQPFLGLWVRDTTGTTPFEIAPTILAVHVRSGLIAAHPPNPSGDPYQFVKDGRVQ